MLKRALRKLRIKYCRFSDYLDTLFIESANFSYEVPPTCELQVLLKVGGDPANGWKCINFHCFLRISGWFSEERRSTTSV